jgi:hypothetical protein
MNRTKEFKNPKVKQFPSALLLSPTDGLSLQTQAAESSLEAMPSKLNFYRQRQVF